MDFTSQDNKREEKELKTGKCGFVGPKASEIEINS
jgi:hypothetical protein